MKKTKRLVALFLAMVMSFAMLAMTAYAYDEGHDHDCTVCSEEEIQPRGPMYGPPCPVCGGQTEAYLVPDDFGGGAHWIFKCISPGHFGVTPNSL